MDDIALITGRLVALEHIVTHLMLWISETQTDPGEALHTILQRSEDSLRRGRDQTVSAEHRQVAEVAMQSFQDISAEAHGYTQHRVEKASVADPDPD